MDVTGMIKELRLELDRIERSILILETFTFPSGTNWAKPPKRRRSPERLAGRPTRGVRTGKVISIARQTNRPERSDGSCGGSPEEYLFRSLDELRTHTAELQKALLLRKSPD